MNKVRRDKKAIILFLLPGFLIYTCMMMLPVLGSIGLSAFKWSGIQGTEIKFVGLRNYVNLFNDGDFWLSLKNIFWFLLVTLLTQLPIGLALALMLSREFKGHRIFRTAYFIPQVVSTTVVGLVWYFILMPGKGILNSVMKAIGLGALTRTWLVDSSTAMTTITLVNTWIGIGFHMTVCLTAIKGIPEDVMEAAQLDGAVGLKRVFTIVIPMIWNTLISSLVVIITAAVKTFDIVFVMTGGGPNGLTNVPSTLLYQEAFQYNNTGGGSAIAVVIFVISISLTLICMRITKRESLEY